MRKQILTAGLTIGMVAFLVGCSGSSPTTSTPAGSGSLYTLVGDLPACNILSLRFSVDGLTLSPESGGNTATLISSSQLVKVNFPALRDFSTVLSLNSVPAGTYSRATLNISVPEMFLYDPSQNPPIKTVFPNLTTSSPTVNIQPPLTVTKNQAMVLRVDLNLAQSVEVDASGQVTGKVTPVFQLTPVNASGTQGFGALDGVYGIVTSVAVGGPTQEFTGSFVLQLLSGTGIASTISITSNTEFFGVSSLNQVLPGDFVEINGFIDANGNFVAQSVEDEAHENPDQNTLAYIGFVTSVTKDSSGNLTQFNLYVRGTEPGQFVNVLDDSVIVVNVSPTTTYQFSSRESNFANLTFDSTGIVLGQELVVHGVYTTPPAPTPPAVAGPTSVNASKVYLKLQTLQGGFASLVQNSSDDKTGAFQFTPCSSMAQGTPVMVLTNNQTSFVNVAGLGELTIQGSLLVKGLPFFESKGTTVNGIAIPPGTLAIVAKQVRKL